MLGANSYSIPCLDALHWPTLKYLSILIFWLNVRLQIFFRWNPGSPKKCTRNYLSPISPVHPFPGARHYTKDNHHHYHHQHLPCIKLRSPLQSSQPWRSLNSISVISPCHCVRPPGIIFLHLSLLLLPLILTVVPAVQAKFRVIHLLHRIMFYESMFATPPMFPSSTTTVISTTVPAIHSRFRVVHLLHWIMF